MYTKGISNRYNGAGLIGKKVRVGPSYISAAKDVIGGSNGYSGELIAIMITIFSCFPLRRSQNLDTASCVANPQSTSF